MRKISLFAALVVAMTAVSCVKENAFETVDGPVAFTAEFSEASTKAVLKPGETSSKVEWQAGDEVSVFAGVENHKFTAGSAGAVTDLTTSDNVATCDKYYAVYPYSETATIAESVITTVLPAEQVAVKGSFATHLAVAQSVSNKFAFKNVCGLVKVNVSSDNVTKVVFEGNSGEVVAGGIAVTVADAPSWTAVAEQGATSVTLLPAEGKTTIEAGDYYFAVLPQTFAAGFKVTSHKNDGYVVERNVATEVTVARSGMVAGKSFGISGKGTEAEPYVIMTVQDMLDMRTLAKLGGETWFKLGADIDMKGVKNYIPVNFDQNFERKIHFDGDNHTIDNFYNDNSSYASLFGVLYGSLKNLKVTNAVIEGKSVAGIIGGYVGASGKPAEVTNVDVQGVVSSTKDRVGGICGVAYDAKFVNCTVDVTVTSTYTNTDGGGDAAGFAGKIQGSSSFTDCSVKAEVSTVSPLKNRTAAFAGWVNGTTVIFKNCHVLTGSKVTDNSGKTASAIGIFGGLTAYAGSSEKTVIDGCTVDVVIDAPWAQSVAGFAAIGSAGGVLEITGSSAKGVLKGSNQVAGMVAYVENLSTLTIRDSYADVDVTGQTSTGSHYCAGIAGNIANVTTVELKNVHSTGDIVSGGSSNAGLVGAIVKGTISFENCYVTGNLSGNNNCGGLGGNIGVPATMKNCYYKEGEITVNGTSGGLVGNSMLSVLENSYVEADITGKAAGIGGLIGSQSVQLAMTGCHYSGNIVTAAENCGGLIGRATAAPANISRCYSTGTLNSSVNKNNLGGLLGYSTAFNMSDCWSSMTVTGVSQSIGGLVGTMGGPSTLRNCYSTGNVTGRASTGGMVGMSYNNVDGNVYENLICWGNVTNTKTTATQYCGGAIIGCVHTKTITAKNCWRGPAVTLTDYQGAWATDYTYNNVLVDNEDIINSVPPTIPGIPEDHANAYAARPYHGKAAAADATISSVAKSLGWDETVWDLTGATPKLK